MSHSVLHHHHCQGPPRAGCHPFNPDRGPEGPSHTEEGVTAQSAQVRDSGKHDAARTENAKSVNKMHWQWSLRLPRLGTLTKLAHAVFTSTDPYW